MSLSIPPTERDKKYPGGIMAEIGSNEEKGKQFGGRNDRDGIHKNRNAS